MIRRPPRSTRPASLLPSATLFRSLDKPRAYHSAYFEMLGEQGYPGLALWLAINLIGISRMEVLRRRYGRAEGDEAWIAPLASALQHGHIIYLLGAAFIAIAFQLFVRSEAHTHELQSLMRL